MKVLFRGGSISAGFGAEKSYVDIVKDELRTKGLEIINRSRHKDTSFEGVWSFNEDIDFFKPDVLILHFGIDDIFRPVYRSEFKENYVQIIRLARARFNPKIFLLTSHIFQDSVLQEAIESVYRSIREISFDMQCILVPMHLWLMSYLQEKQVRIEDMVQHDPRYINDLAHRLFASIVIDTFRRKIPVIGE
jgi:hypothetical protein